MKIYSSTSTGYTDEEIKYLISTKVLKGIADYGLQTALRRIIFDKNNVIDWQEAWSDIAYQMPELDFTGMYDIDDSELKLLSEIE